MSTIWTMAVVAVLSTLIGFHAGWSMQANDLRTALERGESCSEDRGTWGSQAAALQESLSRCQREIQNAETRANNQKALVEFCKLKFNCKVTAAQDLTAGVSTGILGLYPHSLTTWP